jgi:hypothetical protein
LLFSVFLLQERLESACGLLKRLPYYKETMPVVRSTNAGCVADISPGELCNAFLLAKEVAPDLSLAQKRPGTGRR